MLTERASGILLHPTSIPTAFGIGDLGPQAHQFVEWLAAAGQRFWQVLPLCPADFCGSPYQSASSFAGNPLLVSPEFLRDDGLLTDADLDDAALLHLQSDPLVDFGRATDRKQRLLERAALRFSELPGSHALHDELHAFVEANRHWLEPHAQFMASVEAHQGAGWRFWNDSPATEIPPIPPRLSTRFAAHLVFQFFFFRQWTRLRQRAHQLGIRIIGDIPIYVSHDSADVWANRSLFQLDEHGASTRVAGVPPDYFAATGQLWMNPLYDWDAMERDGFAWWIRRLQASLKLVDLVRLDHFRGFESYWSVPAGESTAINGEWVPGPRGRLLSALSKSVTHATSGLNTGAHSHESLPIIAEDLGMITKEVHDLRLQFNLPGMKVLQFMLPGEAWDNTTAEDFEPNSVVYTGTHDNDTSLGWFRSEIAPFPEKLDRLRRYVPGNESDFAWEFIEYAWRSGSNIAITPLQDVLSLDSSARMNTPGTSGFSTTNWRWKYSPGMLSEAAKNRLADLTRATNR